MVMIRTLIACVLFANCPHTMGVSAGISLLQFRASKSDSRDRESRLASVQAELFASQEARREVEDSAAALWRSYLAAADREEALLHQTEELDKEGDSLAAMVPAMRAAEEHALESTRAHQAAEEHAGALREQEESDQVNGRAAVEASDRAMKARQRAMEATVRPSGAESLKELVEDWHSAEDEAAESWARFSSSRQLSTDRIAARTADAFALSPLASLLSSQSPHVQAVDTSLLQVGAVALESQTAHDQEERTSRSAVVQGELQASSRQRRAAENVAAALLEESLLAEGRSGEAKRQVAMSQAKRHALQTSVSSWRAAQMKTADAWQEYSAEEERAGVFREQEEEELTSGLELLAAEKEREAAEGRAGSASAKTLRQAVEAWRSAEERSDELWSTFSDKLARARDHFLVRTRHLSDSSRGAMAHGEEEEDGAGDRFATHLHAAMALAGVVRDAAAHLSQETGRNVSSEVTAALNAVTNVSTALAETAVAKPSLARAMATQRTNANHLGQFMGVPESYADIAGRFPGLLGGQNGFSVAFTAKWDALNRWSRVLDFGNTVKLGSKAHGSNIVVANEKTTDTFAFAIYGAESNAFLTIPRLIKVGESSRFLCSVDEKGHMRVYKDGELVGENKHGVVPAAVPRDHLYLGKSNFDGNAMFAGEIRDLCVWNGPASWKDTEHCAEPQGSK